ncbi:MAG: YHS domain-containing (seleno)protein [Ekhidna sp.]
MKKTLFTLTLLAFSIVSVAQSVFTNKDQVANNGYDVVNYFKQNEATRGSKDYSSVHKGATYYFVSASNKKDFDQNPDKYLPQFDGYCAFAVAKMNQKVPVDPETFRIDDGKLYLFYNDFWEGKPFNTIVPWLNNESEMEKLANTNWESLKSK